MKKLLIITLFILTAQSFAQSIMPLRHKTVRQSYGGDTIETTVGDSVQISSNKDIDINHAIRATAASKIKILNPQAGKKHKQVYYSDTDSTLYVDDTTSGLSLSVVQDKIDSARPYFDYTVCASGCDYSDLAQAMYDLSGDGKSLYVAQESFTISNASISASFSNINVYFDNSIINYSRNEYMYLGQNVIWKGRVKFNLSGQAKAQDVFYCSGSIDGPIVMDDITVYADSLKMNNLFYISSGFTGNITIDPATKLYRNGDQYLIYMSGSGNKISIAAGLLQQLYTGSTTYGVYNSGNTNNHFYLNFYAWSPATSGTLIGVFNNGMHNMFIGSCYGFTTPIINTAENNVVDLNNKTLTLTGTDLNAETGITASMLYENIIYGCNSAIDISANPQIAQGYNGQLLRVIGMHNTNTLKIDNGDGVIIKHGTSRTLKSGDMIELIYLNDFSSWVEKICIDSLIFATRAHVEKQLRDSLNILRTAVKSYVDNHNNYDIATIDTLITSKIKADSEGVVSIFDPYTGRSMFYLAPSIVAVSDPVSQTDYMTVDKTGCMQLTHYNGKTTFISCGNGGLLVEDSLNNYRFEVNQEQKYIRWENNDKVFFTIDSIEGTSIKYINYDANQDTIVVYNPATGSINIRVLFVPITSIPYLQDSLNIKQNDNDTIQWDATKGYVNKADHDTAAALRTLIGGYWSNTLDALSDSTTNNQFGSSTLYPIDHYTNGVLRWRMQGGTGFLGFGTTTPTVPVDINKSYNSFGGSKMINLKNSNTGSNAYSVIQFGNNVADFIGAVGITGGNNSSNMPQIGGSGVFLTSNNAAYKVGIGVNLTAQVVASSATTVGFFTGSTTYNLSIEGNAAKTMGGIRHTTSNTAGNDFTIYWGSSATSGATDKNSGNGIFSCGQYSTGNGGGDILFKTIAFGQGAGTTDRQPVDREYVTSRILADNGSFTLNAGRSGMGWVTVGDDEEYAYFTFTSAGVVTLRANSANITTTQGTDNSVNIYDAGTQVGIEQTFTASKQLTVKIVYGL